MNEFDYNIATTLKQALEKQGIDRPYKVFDKEYFLFSDEELVKIEELVIQNGVSLEGIDKLPKLKKLTLMSAEYTRISGDVDLSGTAVINNIMDFHLLEKLSNLQELIIANDINLKELDISRLKKLKKIKLINDPQLEELVGLDQLRSLEEIMIYGTSIHSSFDIFNYIENTSDASVNILDVNMYASLVHQGQGIPEFISKSAALGMTNLKFAELVGLMDFAILEPSSLEEMYNKSDILFKLYGVYDLPISEQIRFIYQYTVKNVSFDYEKISKRNDDLEKYRNTYNEIPEYKKQKFAMIHSSYTALMSKKSNCEGAVNLMKFMLNLLDIRSFNVHCIDLKNNINGFPNHSMIRIFNKEAWYYCDPMIEHEERTLGTEKYFMKTYEEVLEMNRYRLNGFETLIQKGHNYGQLATADSHSK